MNKKMTPEERDVVVAQLSLLLDGLAPNELHDLLLAAGVYAPAVTSTSYVRNILRESVWAVNHEDDVLAAVRDRTIRMVDTWLRGGDALRSLVITSAGHKQNRNKPTSDIDS
jgi:hypothetical protein